MMQEDIESTSELKVLETKTNQMLDNGKAYYRNALERNSISDLHHSLLYIKASCSDLIKYGFQNVSAAYWCSLVYSRMAMDYYTRCNFVRCSTHAENGLHLLEKMDFSKVEASDIHQDDTPDNLRIRLYFALGASCIKLKDFERAEEYLRKGLELSPHHAELTSAFHEAQAELDRFQRKRSLGRNDRNDDDLKRKTPGQNIE